MPEISRRRRAQGETTYQEICQNSTLNLIPAWYLGHTRYQVRDGNSFNVYCSGEKVFGDIATSILNAKKSADIVCTFFDPAMLLTRKHADYNTRNGGHSAWHESDSFGGIIIQALKDNPELKIRLVLWLHQVGQLAGGNVIGIIKNPREESIPHSELATGFDIRQIPDPDPNRIMWESYGRDERKYASLELRSRTQEAADYSKKWFQRVTWEVEDKNTGRHSLFDRLCITRRAISTPFIINQEDERFPAEQRTLEFGCDHQKSVLIDLDDAAREGSDPHGYVLGHNYFTQYWTRFPFKHRDPAHEMDYVPYHDFSMQIRGPLLIDLNKNFCEAYGAVINRGAPAQREDIFTIGRVENPLIYPNSPLPTSDPNVFYNIGETPTDGRRYSRAAYKRAVRSLEEEVPQELYRQRFLLEPQLRAKKGNASGQVVRTRPDQTLHGAHEKEIKDAYLQVVRHATNFLLLVNQYFQYNRLARQIKHWKNQSNVAFQKAPSCKGMSPRKLYLFLGTCKSEKHGMVWRTQQMANEFGVGDQFESAHDELYDKDDVDKEGHRSRTDMGVNMRSQTHITLDDVEALHIKPLFFMFYTQIPPASQRTNPGDHVAQQVYVHAKLMIEDDAWFTLGSANTNIRSMAVDSELNIISDDKETAQKVRHELLREYVGEIKGKEVFPNVAGRELNQSDLKAVHKIMEIRMDDNQRLIGEKKTITGLIAKFHDDRSADVVRLA
ncbi:MAG: phospholipase D-like domain-containing protein [Saezia sp.]